MSEFQSNSTSSVNLYGGGMGCLCTCNSSSASIYGGSVSGYLAPEDNSSVYIYGGSVAVLYAYDSSTVRFYGQDFSLGSGLSIDGTLNGWWRLLGTGVLSGEWMNGTPWTTNISENNSTILLIPEPTTLLLLGLGGLALLRRRRA